MKLPRDLSGAELAKALRLLDYTVVRQDGSHLRLTTQRDGQNHVTIPNHRALKIGTLRAILKAVGEHHSMSVEEIAGELGL